MSDSPNTSPQRDAYGGAGPAPGSAAGPSTAARLATAARAATLMAYVVALVGAAGGTLALRDGDLATALLVWTVTLGVAALLGATSTLVRALRETTERLDAIERVLRGRRAD